MSKKVKVYTTSGWQDVRAHSESDTELPIAITERPREQAHAVMSPTYAQNKSLPELLHGLLQEAGVGQLSFRLITSDAS